MKRYLVTAIAVSLIMVACGGDGAEDTVATPAATAVAPSSTGTAPAETTAASALAKIDVEITTADGLVLEATEYPGGPNWVVLAHMRPADKASWSDLAELFRSGGYSVLAYNNRGYGASQGEREAFQLLTDAQAALDHARAQGAESLVFGGASMNGAAAIALGAADDFAAIFTLSAVAAFPSVTNVAAAAMAVEEPILFAAARDDGNAVADATALFDLATDSDLIALESGGHGTDMLEADPGLGKRIVDWVNERLATSD